MQLKWTSILAFVVWCGGEAIAARYVISPVHPPQGWNYFQPRKVNDRGQMIGRLDASEGPFADQSHAGFYTDGRVVDMHLLARGWQRMSASLPLDLNDHGVGLFYGLGDGPRDRTFLFHHGRLQEFSRLVRRTDLDPAGLNNRGEIVGGRFDLAANTWREAFLWRHGKLHFLPGLPGYEYTGALDINDRGLIAGGASDEELDIGNAAILTRTRAISLGISNSWTRAINAHGHILGLKNGGGFIWKGPGAITHVPFAPDEFNNSGQVVGSSGPWPPHARLFENGIDYDLNDLLDPGTGWLLIYAHDINNRGEIVGWGRVNERWSGYILRPRVRR